MKQHQMQSGIWAGLPAAVIAVIIGFLLSAVVPNSHAADKTWNGAGDGTTMSSVANWVGGVPPVGGTDSLIFDGTGAVINNDYAGSAGNAFAGIIFNAGAGAFTIHGNALYLSGGITNNSPNLQYFTNIVNLNGLGRIFNAAVGQMQFDAVSGGSYFLVKDGTNIVTF